jgi:hypothetical protein
MNNLKFHLIVVLFLLAAMGVCSQSLPIKKLDREKWKELKRDLSYDEKNIAEDWTKNFEDDETIKSKPNQSDKNLDKKKSNNQKGLGKYSQRNTEMQNKQTTRKPISIPPWLSTVLLILLSVIIIGVLLWIWLYNKKTGNPKIIQKTDEENLQDSIEKTQSELEQMLAKAMAEKDYRLAVRIYFVFIIKLLKEKELITWDKKKTNTQYLREMQNNAHFSTFHTCVNLFEMIWYGKRQLNENEFYIVEPLFKNYLQKIEK